MVGAALEITPRVGNRRTSWTSEKRLDDRHPSLQVNLKRGQEADARLKIGDLGIESLLSPVKEPASSSISHRHAQLLGHVYMLGLQRDKPAFLSY